MEQHKYVKKMKKNNTYPFLFKLKIASFILYLTILSIAHHLYSNTIRNRSTKVFSTTTTSARYSSSNNDESSLYESSLSLTQLWNGNSLYPDNLPAKLKISVIISYCNDVNGLKPYVDYINDIISKEVNNITIV